jgi:hypothetical protein
MNLINIILLGIIVVAGGYMFMFYTGSEYKKRKGAFVKNKSIRQLQRKANWTDFKDFFWRRKSTFTWMTLILSFGFLFGLALDTPFGHLLSFIFFVLMILFFYWTRKNYIRFALIAKERLDNFDNEVKEILPKDGEKIFTIIDEKKIVYNLPTRPKKEIVIERKMEFVIIYDEYVAICQKASKFNLFDHRGDAKKKFEYKKGAGGGCSKFFYLKIKKLSGNDNNINFIYDGEEEKIELHGKGGKGAVGAIQAKLDHMDMVRHKPFKQVPTT